MVDEALLKQLGYSNISDSLKNKLNSVIENTKDFEHIGSKHIVSLNDTLKPHLSYVALSNSHDYFKIKNEAQTEAIKEEVDEIIHKWAAKHKVELQKVAGKETYYILGFQK